MLAKNTIPLQVFFPQIFHKTLHNINNTHTWVPTEIFQEGAKNNFNTMVAVNILAKFSHFNVKYLRFAFSRGRGQVPLLP